MSHRKARDLVDFLRAHGLDALHSSDDPGPLCRALDATADAFAELGGVPAVVGDALLTFWRRFPPVRDTLLWLYFGRGLWVYTSNWRTALSVILGDVVPAGGTALSAALMELTRTTGDGALVNWEYGVPQHYLRWWLREHHMDHLRPEHLPELLSVRVRTVGWSAISAEFVEELCRRWGSVPVSTEAVEQIRQAVALPGLPASHRRIVHRRLCGQPISGSPLLCSLPHSTSPSSTEPDTT